MGRIDTYPENASIEDNDKLLTYDTSASATRNTPFSRIWPWIQSKLNALTKQTAIASTDQLLMVKGGNTTGRIDYNVLAKAIIEQYKSSTLAGSAQSIQEAFNALNSNIYGDVLPTDTDINSVITVGTYACYGSNTYTNLPSGQTYGTLQVIKHSKTTGWITQIFYVGSTAEYKRNTTTAGTSWGAWTLVPTRAEMDAVSSRISVGESAKSLSVKSNNNAGDTCFFMIDRSDGISYKISFGTNGNLLFQKYENDTWSTVWTK